MYMNHMHTLRSVDLNLLVVLEAVLEERQVSRAAMRLGMTQPAVSHALRRLRDLLGDELLLRRGARMVPTVRALSIAGDLHNILDQTRRLLKPDAFDPAKVRQVVRLAMSDYGSAIILPSLLRRIRSRAPGLTLHVRHLSRDGMLRAAEEGIIDAALGVFPTVPASLTRNALFTETFLCALDRSHPASRKLDLKRYLAADHIVVSMNGEPESDIDAELSRRGWTRRIALVLPHFWTALPLVAGTDLILTVASRVLRDVKQYPRIAVHKPPFEIPAISFELVRKRAGQNYALDWLQAQIRDDHSSAGLKTKR